MTRSETLIEVLKIVAPIVITYIGLLKTRVDLDRFAASQRAKETKSSLESQIRRRWYHPLFKQRKKKRTP